MGHLRKISVKPTHFNGGSTSRWGDIVMGDPQYIKCQDLVSSNCKESDGIELGYEICDVVTKC